VLGTGCHWPKTVYFLEKVIVVLRDKRNIIGILRSCDQFNNMFLTEAVERIHIEKEFGDIPMGIFMIRGDTVVLVGELVSSNAIIKPAFS
jgi:U6 snRNA-associated Sm-like protein LSm1